MKLDRVLVVGLAVTGRAVTDALLRRDITVLVADDAPSPAAVVAAQDRELDLVVAPGDDVLAAMLGTVDAVVPSPGVPRHHAVYRLADAAGVPVVSEFDLAAWWDDRPQIAITGTNGKTTVTTLVTAMLRRAGIAAVAAGNVDVPLVEAIDRVDDPMPEWFVVEASSFRLERVVDFAPRVGAWLNLAPDHLDWHDDLEAYAAAKARIWRNHGPDDVKVVPIDDPVIARHVEAAEGRTVTFGDGDGDVRVVGGSIISRVGGDDEIVVDVERLRRRLPHDLLNACAATACAQSVGASVSAIAEELIAFEGLAHRMALVATIDGVAYYDDSKATTPEATMAAVHGFDRAVLIAGGRNKGLDLSALGSVAGHLSLVIAIGEAADAVEQAFGGAVPVVRATSMSEAVDVAASATAADAVILSPACASFDWYRNYAERGDDFSRIVESMAAEGVG